MFSFLLNCFELRESVLLSEMVYDWKTTNNKYLLKENLQLTNYWLDIRLWKKL